MYVFVPTNIRILILVFTVDSMVLYCRLQVRCQVAGSIDHNMWNHTTFKSTGITIIKIKFSI